MRRVCDAHVASTSTGPCIGYGILINGGAAAGLVTFLGGTVTKPEAASLRRPLSVALALFGLGVLASAVAAAFVYLTQLANAHHVEALAKSIEARGQEQVVRDFRRESDAHRVKVQRYNAVAIWCGLGSLVVFAAGLASAFWAFWVWR